MAEVNEKILRIRGNQNIGTDYALGDDLVVRLTVDGIEDRDNHDGTVNRIFKAKLFKGE